MQKADPEYEVEQIHGYLSNGTALKVQIFIKPTGLWRIVHLTTTQGQITMLFIVVPY